MNCGECNRTNVMNLAKGTLAYIVLQYAAKYATLNTYKGKEKLMRGGVFAATSFVYDKAIERPLMSLPQIEQSLGSCSKCVSRDTIIVIVEILRDLLMKGESLDVKHILNEILCVFGADWIEHKLQMNNVGGGDYVKKM
jgi:hypothetical protein